MSLKNPTDTNAALKLILESIAISGIKEKLFAAEQLHKVITDGHTAFHEAFPDTSCDSYFQGLEKAMGMVQYAVVKSNGAMKLADSFDISAKTYLELHKYSLDKDPAVRIYGRMSKQLLPVLMQALSLEEHRGDVTSHEVYLALISVFGFLISMTAESLAEDGRVEECNIAMLKEILADTKGIGKGTSHGSS